MHHEKNNLVSMFRVTTNIDFNNELDWNKYLYYSIELEHHLYFLSKRIFKLLLDNFQINIKNIRDTNLLNKIKEAINCLETTNFILYTKYIKTDNNFLKLIRDNSFNPKNNCGKDFIIHVDHTKYKGGLGFNNLWLKLFQLLTYYQKINPINNQDMIIFLHRLEILIKDEKDKSIWQYAIKAGYSLFKPEGAYDLLLLEDYSNEIQKTLEEIYINKLIPINSSFYKNPNKTINNIVTNYQKNRKLILTKNDSNFTYYHP